MRRLEGSSASGSVKPAAADLRLGRQRRELVHGYCCKHECDHFKGEGLLQGDFGEMLPGFETSERADMIVRLVVAGLCSHDTRVSWKSPFE